MRRRDGAGSSARIPGGALVHQLLEMESVAGEKTSGVADRPVVFLDSSSLCTWAPTVALCVTALDSGQKEEHGPAARDARPSALFPQAQDARGDGLVGMVLLLRRKEELRKSVLFRWILLPLISANFVAVVGFSTPTLCMD